MTEVEIEASVEAVLQQGVVHTEVVLVFLFPADVRIDVLAYGIGIDICAVIPECASVGEELHAAQVAAQVVTGDTEACTELEFVHPVDILHKRFAAYTPSGADSREKTPLVVGSEAGRSLPAKRSGKQVLFVVIVVRACELGNQGVGVALGAHFHILLGRVAIPHFVILHHIGSGKAFVCHVGRIVEEVLVGYASHHRQVVAVEPAAPICREFEKLIERSVVSASGLFGAGGIGVDDAAIIVIIVVSFFDSCETAHLEALDGFDVHRGLDAAAEVVTLAVRLLLIHVFHGIHESGFLGTPEIAVGGGFVIDGIGRVQQGRILEVAAEIIVAVAHVAEVVLEVQPTVEGLLAGGQRS